MEAIPCKHFQTGFCKFREQCRKNHIIEMCQTEQCASESCNKRHPKLCKYFSTFCKFGDNCCYKHVTPKSNTVTDTTHIVSQLKSLGEQIKIMSNTIINLEKEISTFKKTSPSKIIFMCDECGYEASSETVLKRHITSKHKVHIPTPEKERSTEHDNSIQLLMTVDERAAALYSPPQPHDEDIAQIPITLQDIPSPALPHSSVTKTVIPRKKALIFTCHFCKNVFKERYDFNNHLTEKHNL